MTLGWQYIRRRGTDLKALPTKILAVIKALQSANGSAALPNLVVFLCACESEGMTVKELAYVSGLSTTAVSRALHTLCDTECAPDAQSRARPGEPLMVLTRHLTDGRRHVVRLTDAGRQLKDQVEFIFSDRAVMIAPPLHHEELAGHP
jgi:DNA-binding MarR family transcriptional regulator